MAFFHQSIGGEISLAWDPVDDYRVGGYELHYGPSSGTYNATIDARDSTALTVADLDAGSMYFFRVRAYSQDRMLWSAFSNEESGTATNSVTPPVANFNANKTSGTIPLTVTFSDSSSGAIDSYEWDFGDGTTAAGSTAAHTYTSAMTYTVSLTVTGPGGTDTATKTDLVNVVNVRPPAPFADFTTDRTSGAAPLAVVFTNDSSGDITQYEWKFGDGGTSSQADPDHTYDLPGTYDVTLTVTGPGGSDILTKAGLVQVSDQETVIEVGEVEFNHEWTYVDFKHTFYDPVVIIKPLSGNGGQPAVVRVEVDNVDPSSYPNGFRVRIQEWGYLDQWHVTEIASYMVMERGTHQLTNGTWIEADHVDVSSDFVAMGFTAPFADAPVVLSTVTTFNEADAVTTRQRNIDKFGFEVRLQEQEANKQQHAFEVVDYIAWEPSAGEFDGLVFEVGRTADQVTHRNHTIDFSTDFEELPLFLADMQSTDGGDTANLRCNNASIASIDVWVDEEQSRDTEIGHTTETLGYVALATASQSPYAVTGLEAAYGFDEASGTNVFDASSNGNDGIFTGTVRVNGKFGNAIVPANIAEID